MKYILILFYSTILFSCNWFKEKGKQTVNKTGEVVAKAGAELADGMSKGVEKTFSTQAIFSAELIKEGLKAGKIIINSSDSTTDNILSVYLIFDNDFNKKVTLKIFDEDGQEYGRISQLINGEKNEGKYVDFVFDKRTNIDGKGKVSFE